MSMISAGLNSLHLENQRLQSDNSRLTTTLRTLRQTTVMRDKLIDQLRKEVISLRHALSQAKQIAPQIKCVCPNTPIVGAATSEEDVLQQIELFFEIHGLDPHSLSDDDLTTSAASVSSSQRSTKISSRAVESPQLHKAAVTMAMEEDNTTEREGIPLSVMDAVCTNTSCDNHPKNSICHKPCHKRVALVNDIETLPAHLMPQNMLEDK